MSNIDKMTANQELFTELTFQQAQTINGGGRLRRKLKRKFKKFGRGLRKGWKGIAIGVGIAIAAIFTGGTVKGNMKNGGATVGGEWEF